jgi:hypothetical protein
MRSLMMAATGLMMGALALASASAAFAQVGGGGGGGGEGAGAGQMTPEEIARKIEEIAQKMDQVEADLLKLAAEAKTERAAEIAEEIEQLLREGKSPEEIQQIIDKQLQVMNDITELMKGAKNEQEELINEMTELVKTIERMQQKGQGPPQEGEPQEGEGDKPQDDKGEQNPGSGGQGDPATEPYNPDGSRQPNTRNEGDDETKGSWNASLPPNMRDTLAAESRRNFPEKYRKLLEKYFRD